MHSGSKRSSLPTLLSLAVIAAALGGCAAPVVPSAPSRSTTPVPATTLACPDVTADGSPNGSGFATDVFARDESNTIARAFIDALAGIYAGSPDADPCAWFTARGLRTAMETDARLRDVIEGRTRIRSDLVMRLAHEGAYDLRKLPPTVPLSVIFDLPAGSRTTDLATATSTVSTAAQRAGLRLDFAFDGTRWLADRVGPVEGEDADLVVLPTPPPPGEPCTGFRADPPGTPFDDASGTDFLVDPPMPERAWCDAGGRGRVADETQLVLLTRYPCNRGPVAILTIGLPLGMPIDRLNRYEFVRDPAGEFLAQGWVTAPFEPDATLPADAASTGWTNGNAELWISPRDLDAAIFMRVGDATERWPRAADEWGVTDCN